MLKRLKNKLLQFTEFSLVGTTGFAIQVFLTLLLTEVVRITYYWSYAFALITTWLFSFTFNMKLTFESTGGFGKRLAKFAILAAGSLIINWLIVVSSVAYLKIHYLMSIIFVSLILSFVSFTLQDLWIFTNKKKQDA